MGILNCVQSAVEGNLATVERGIVCDNIARRPGSSSPEQFAGSHGIRIMRRDANGESHGDIAAVVRAIENVPAPLWALQACYEPLLPLPQHKRTDEASLVVV